MQIRRAVRDEAVLMKESVARWPMRSVAEEPGACAGPLCATYGISIGSMFFQDDCISRYLFGSYVPGRYLYLLRELRAISITAHLIILHLHAFLYTAICDLTHYNSIITGGYFIFAKKLATGIPHMYCYTTSLRCTSTSMKLHHLLSTKFLP